MKQWFLAAAIAIPMGSAALADDVTGAITELSAEDNRLTLDNGMVYWVRGGNLAEFKVGDRVTLTYDPTLGVFQEVSGIDGNVTKIVAAAG